MKLKVRIPLLFSVLVLVLAVLMAIYIRTSIIGNVIMNVKELREEQQVQDIAIQKKMSKMYPDVESMKKYVNELNQEDDIAISLFDTSFHRMGDYSVVNGSEDGDERHWYQIQDASGETVFLISVKRPLQPGDIELDAAYAKLFIFLLICLSIIFVGLTVYLHHFITKPIQRLNNRLRGIKSSPVPHPYPLITLRRDEIGELYEHVGEMENRLQQSNKEQIDMIAAITHDIKTPLTSVNGFIELLLTKDSLSIEDRRDYMRLIEKKSKHLTELINEFSNYTKSEVLLPDITLTSVNFKNYFEKTAVEYEEELSGLDIQFTWKHSIKGRDTVLIHEGMLRRVFANLISNVVRYGGKDELQIHMRGYAKDGKAIFIIEDNGVGVAEEYLPFLFQKFFTVDSSRQIEAGGTGLGLASCKSIIERHGGAISVFMSTMGGLGIHFYLPLEFQT
ncbi:hypothetical protein A8L34_12590 [Bacillus sp. FJAT-27264]|uniref:sensor histidine kinase n=1 Tax=Paenibacillus sp. (strain DSM 101736 / FJAT-27264) TaxID=1850362 RepID=UPI000807B7FC|nr:HAMP domain-containing sensor histidine kinase [Bacillus sp. FJAT-27264]OBZ14741.1 hypothetical protein A8L34_12590 [Bacillus sp. FJAT-27264]